MPSRKVPRPGSGMGGDGEENNDEEGHEIVKVNGGSANFDARSGKHEKGYKPKWQHPGSLIAASHDNNR